MSKLSTRFIRQVRSEWTFVRTDRNGHTVLLLGLLVSILWGVFLSYLTVVYQDEDTAPSPRVPAGGLAQLGYYALMIWAVLLLLGTKAKGYWNMRLLVQPSRPIVALATLVHLTVWSAIFSVLVVAFSTVTGIAVTKVMGHDPTPLYGTPSEIGVVVVQMVGLSVGACWIAAGCALLTNSVGTAITTVVVWPILVEGMLPDSGAGEVLRRYMPFVNGLAWYQDDSELQLSWPEPVGLVYFLSVGLALALTGVWVRRNETLNRTN